MDGVLDARARQELADLRRRAYGTDADILTDPAALARLEALERRAHVAAPTVLGKDTGEDAAAMPSAIRSRSAPPAVARPAWYVSLIAACGVVALALSAFAAVSAARQIVPTPQASAITTEMSRDVRAFTSSTTTRVVARLPVDGPMHLPADSAERVTPLFPTEDALLWADPLGQYFGVHVWMARTVGGDSCLLAELPGTDRGTCVDAEQFDRSALLVTVPFSELAEGTRPLRMVADESFGIWWRPDRPIDLLIGPTPPL